MKKLILVSCLIFCIGSSDCYAQFWQGFMRGMMQAAQQQQYYQQQYYNQNRQQRKRNVDPIEETRKYEDGGFVWIELSQYNSSKEKWVYGAKDENGKTIIPLSRGYTNIYYQSENNYGGYFEVEKDDKAGICDRYGKVLFTPKDNASYLCLDGIFNKKNSSGEWKETNTYLDSNGHGHTKSNSSSAWGSSYYSTPYYPTYDTPTYTAPTTNYEKSTVTGTDPQSTLNQTVGESCRSCMGSGKCNACHGTKIASGLGNTYECNVCNANGDCPVCHGTGKAGWNR